MKILSEDDKIILIDFNGECQHEIVVKKAQLRSKERKDLGIKIIASGTQNIKNEHIIHNMIGKF